jgi:hypothetical protein
LVNGLDESAHYRVRMVWPRDWKAKSTPSIVSALNLTGDGAVISAEALQKVGMQLPLTVPETVFLYHFQREDEAE